MVVHLDPITEAVEELSGGAGGLMTGKTIKSTSNAGRRWASASPHAREETGCQAEVPPPPPPESVPKYPPPGQNKRGGRRYVIRQVKNRAALTGRAASHDPRVALAAPVTAGRRGVGSARLAVEPENQENGWFSRMSEPQNVLLGGGLLV